MQKITTQSVCIAQLIIMLRMAPANQEYLRKYLKSKGLLSGKEKEVNCDALKKFMDVPYLPVQFMTLPEVIAYTNICKSDLRTMVRYGHLRSFSLESKKKGSRLLFHPEDVESMYQAHAGETFKVDGACVDLHARLNRLTVFFESVLKLAYEDMSSFSHRDWDIFKSLTLGTRSVQALMNVHDLSRSGVFKVYDQVARKSAQAVRMVPVIHKKYGEVLGRNADLVSQIEFLKHYIGELKSENSKLIEPEVRISELDRLFKFEDFGARIWNLLLKPRDIKTLGQLLEYRLFDILDEHNLGRHSAWELFDYVEKCGHKFVDHEEFAKKCKRVKKKRKSLP